MTRPTSQVKKEHDKKYKELLVARKKLVGIGMELRRNQEAMIRGLVIDVDKLALEAFGDWLPDSMKGDSDERV